MSDDDDDVNADDVVVGGSVDNVVDDTGVVLLVDKLVLHKHKSVSNINKRTSSLIGNFKRCNKINDILPVVITRGGDVDGGGDC